MKNIFCSLCFFILHFISFSQSDSLPSDSANNKKHSKYSMGIIISPENTFRKLDSLYTPLWPISIPDSIDLIERPKTAINFGFNFSVSISSHLKFQTGFLVKDMGYSNIGYIYFDDTLTRTLAVYKDSKKEKSTFLFGEVPIIFDYGFISADNKWKFGFFSGILFDLNLTTYHYKSRYYYAYTSNPNQFNVAVHHDKFSTIRLGISTGISFSYFCSENLMISMSPVYKYYFQTFYSQNFTGKHSQYKFPITYFDLKEIPY